MSSLSLCFGAYAGILLCACIYPVLSEDTSVDVSAVKFIALKLQCL